jgi:endonuclease YncB( thermonuclease family)
VSQTIWIRPAVVDHVHDGDTVIVAIDLGKIGRKRKPEPDVDLGWHISERADGHVLLKSAVRIQGLAAPELSTVAGTASAAYAKTLLRPGDTVMIDSLELYGSFEKWGRVLAGVTLPDGRDFSAAMIAANQAVPWDGRGKQPGS